jgi:preprotein translocase subunit YajC
MFGMIAVLLVFMFMSSNKRKKAAAETASKVVVGARIMLTSGIYGEITEINDDRITLKSAGSTVLEVAKGAVARVVENAPEKKAAAKKPAAKKPAAK